MMMRSLFLGLVVICSLQIFGCGLEPSKPSSFNQDDAENGMCYKWFDGMKGYCQK